MSEYIPSSRINEPGTLNLVNQKSEEKVEVKTVKEEIGLIEIPKIELRRYLYDMSSDLNDVDKNIEILKSSNMPDEDNGNLILAGHNGNTSVGYFRSLHKLSLNDLVIIEYKGKRYIYVVSDIYDVLKTGKVAIRRDKSKRTITLITCLGMDRQLVVIGYLKEIKE